MSGTLFLGLILGACGGSPPTVAESPAEQDETITSVFITPTESERAGGGSEVRITDEKAVSDWVSSPAFSPSGWEKKTDASLPRYVVSFHSRDGEVAKYYLGTLEGEAIEYRCFGLCAKWWVAPATEGKGEIEYFRPLGDVVWHPLAREWYMFSR